MMGHRNWKNPRSKYGKMVKSLLREHGSLSPNEVYFKWGNKAPPLSSVINGMRVMPDIEECDYTNQYGDKMYRLKE